MIIVQTRNIVRIHKNYFLEHPSNDDQNKTYLCLQRCSQVSCWTRSGQRRIAQNTKNSYLAETAKCSYTLCKKNHCLFGKFVVVVVVTIPRWLHSVGLPQYFEEAMETSGVHKLRMIPQLLFGCAPIANVMLSRYAQLIARLCS